MSPPPTKRCVTDDDLAGWVEGRLTPTQISAVEGHLGGCNTCRVVLSELARTTEPRPLAGTLGRYVLQEEIGAGGMGAVWAAWDPTLGRKVAVKIIHEAPRDAAALAQRFVHEREILAGLEHPNIARLLDAGETPEGRSYFVMELVDGQPIDQFCDSRKLSPRQRLALMRPVFAAVTHAHQHLVVHRDLKPGNILVTTDAVPKLVDFGIARLLEDGTRVTSTGLAPMTPAFASPEQVRREPAATPSDVYSLGVVLHELLTGVGPYAVPPGNVEALLTAIRDGELKPCSAAVSRADDTMVFNRAPARDRLRRELEGEVDAIVAMALRREPKDRYASVQALDDDIGAWLDGRPTLAGRSSSLYRAVKLIRRHKTSAAALLAAFVALSAGLVATLWQARRAERERDAAQRRFEQVRTLAHAVLFDYHDGIADLPGSTPMRERLVKDGLAYLDSLSGDARTDVPLRRELAQAYLKVGDVQGDPFSNSLGDTTSARASYLKGREIAVELLKTVPGDVAARKVEAQSHEKAGAILEVSGDLRSALAEYQEARRLDTLLAAQLPDDLEQRYTLSRDLLSTGQLLLQLGELDAASAVLEECLATRRKLALDAPDAKNRRGVVIALASVGDARKEQGRVKEAIALLDEAEPLAAALVAEQPDSPTMLRTQATLWSRLVVVYLLDGQRPRALDYAARPLAQAKKAVAQDPENALALRDLVVAYSGLGSAQESADQIDLAAKSKQEALTILRKMRNLDPDNLQTRRDLCMTLVSAGFNNVSRKDWKAALANFDDMYAETMALIPLDPNNVTVLESKSDALNGRAMALAGMKQFEEAAAENRKAMEGIDALLARSPELGRVANRRALYLATEGEFRFDQSVDHPSKATWKQAAEALSAAITALNDLDKTGARAKTTDNDLKTMTEHLNRCRKELGLPPKEHP